MNISPQTLKYYGIPALVSVLIILIVLIVPINPRKADQQNTPPSPTSAPQMVLPTKAFSLPTEGPTPTLIPINFTGAEPSQELPAELRDLGLQKTALRKQTPLTLSFGTITFDYANDSFQVFLNDPSQAQVFFDWLQTTYPIIPPSQFAIQ